MPASDEVPVLLFREGGEWAPLPSWAMFLFQLGTVMGAWTHPKERLIAAVSLPTRAYAALLIAAGFLSERSIYKQMGGTASLEPGSSVFVQDAFGWYRARVEGPVVLPGGEPALRLKIAKDVTEYLLAKRTRRIRRSAKTHVFTGRRKSYDQYTPVDSDLCEQLLKGDTTTYLATPGLDCLIAGAVGEMQGELSTTEFWAVESSGKCRGRLAEVVRPFGFEGIGNSWHTRVLGTHNPLVATLAPAKPEVVILDGGAACRRWRTSFPSSEMIMVLDRSVPNVGEGASEVIEMHASRLEGGGPELPPVPEGMEVTLFRGPRFQCF
ncbi:hypothetical protein HI113_07235 [Corallococcus exiguus]|uniref:hypothetical protein n=1 Tax=Corallococcus exiguus TaxID=83462 RepID=UPI0014736E7A|nr:hypothetical protein [Corallococcus exiguus]NNB93701.1 hypothetical protein [Corallococcus exiguus]